MDILVTGGAGFIGSRLVKKLVKEKHNVIIVDDMSEGLAKNIEKELLEPNCYLYPYDIVETLPDKKFDVVYHLAAKRCVPLSFEFPEKYIRDNILGTHKLLKAYADGKTRIVNISSSTAEQCISPYGISKRAAEQFTALYKNTVSLRFFNVFGEKQPSNTCIVPSTLRELENGKSPIIHGDGKQARDFTYLGDVINEVIKYGQGEYKDKTGQYDIGYGQSITVNDMCHKITNLYGTNFSPIKADNRIGDIRTTKARHIIDSPEFGFEEGLRRTIEWAKSTHYYR
jgi:nucleoside-diphosphate-sugar epimerase